MRGRLGSWGPGRGRAAGGPGTRHGALGRQQAAWSLPQRGDRWRGVGAVQGGAASGREGPSAAGAVAQQRVLGPGPNHAPAVGQEPANPLGGSAIYLSSIMLPCAFQWTYMCSPSGLCATLAAMADARDVISIYLSIYPAEGNESGD